MANSRVGDTITACGLPMSRVLWSLNNACKIGKRKPAVFPGNGTKNYKPVEFFLVEICFSGNIFSLNFFRRIFLLGKFFLGIFVKRKYFNGTFLVLNFFFRKFFV